jgi:membrane protease YdiL (CAAX protease family)
MNESTSKFIQLWLKLPLVVRAIILGFLISTIGIGTSILVSIIIPMPWSFILMSGLLWIYVKYFSGSWWPESTRLVRKIRFRPITLPVKQWVFAMISIVLVVLIEQSSLVVTFRFIEFPAEQFTAAYSFLADAPVWAAWLLVIMISAVAAICEETGFRGYMQVPLEKRYGPLVSISIVSIVFVLVHLHQAWSGPLIVHIFFISVLFGTLAYYSGSLIPGIIAHFIMDICNFSFWWSDLGGQFSKEPISITGVDTHFVLWSVFFLAGVAGFVVMVRRMRLVKELTPALS